MILIDTDICIEYLKDNKTVISSFATTNDQFGMSFMSIGELYFGAYNSSRLEHHLNIILFLSDIFEIVHSDDAICKTFGQLKALLQSKGELIPDADIFIAATAIEKSATLATGNTKHFDRLKDYGLNVENWM